MAVGSINYGQYLYGTSAVTQKRNQYTTPGFQQNNISAETKQEKSSKISTKKMIGIALGLSAIAAGIILFKKWNATPVKQLAEHIDFVKADKVEDAVKFAKETLGVKLKVNDQLKTANWINESLVNLSNKTKGKVLMPKEIRICKLAEGLHGKYNPFTRTVKLSQAQFGSCFEKDFEAVKRSGYLNSRLETLYHEIGHGIHLTVSNIFNELFGTPKFKKTISSCKDALSEWLGGKYFTRCEGETFAQIFGKKMAGDKLPNYAENVWKNIGGKY